MSSRPDNVANIFAGTGRHKPDTIKKTQGTYRNDRAKAEAQYKRIGEEYEPVPPDWMVDPVARDHFEEAFRLLRNAGVLTFADLGILEIYAVERALIQRRYEQSYKIQSDAEGRLEYVINSNMVPGTEKLNAFRVLSSELGFTPVSRHKVSSGQKSGGSKDEWEDV